MIKQGATVNIKPIFQDWKNDVMAYAEVKQDTWAAIGDVYDDDFNYRFECANTRYGKGYIAVIVDGMYVEPFCVADDFEDAFERIAIWVRDNGIGGSYTQLIMARMTANDVIDHRTQPITVKVRYNSIKNPKLSW